MSAPVHGPLELARCDVTLRETIEQARASAVRLTDGRRVGARLDDPLGTAAQHAYMRDLCRVTELIGRLTALGERFPFCTESRAS